MQQPCHEMQGVECGMQGVAIILSEQVGMERNRNRGCIDSVRRSENQHCLGWSNENELGSIHLELEDNLRDDQGQWKGVQECQPLTVVESIRH